MMARYHALDSGSSISTFGMTTGRRSMNKHFEILMRKKYGNRYDLTRDVDGYYCREIVKRMFEIYCECKGGDHG